MCFGLTAAPLLWSRFAGLLARLLVACYAEDEMGLQLYLDDPFFVLIGKLAQREELLALFLRVLLAFRVNVASRKSLRPGGPDSGSITWIGVTFTLLRTLRAVSVRMSSLTWQIL